MMFAVGLWHGASWTFVAWGALHGLMLGARGVAAMRFAPTWRCRRTRRWMGVTFASVTRVDSFRS
jgi:D-alanyl-lipoteichoic acid acyltransferase DltB (MBOAT superfamily)